MRLSTDDDRDEDLARQTIAAAAGAGITVFDTARAYGRGEAELGHNERLLAAALRGCRAHDRARIVTKGGMARAGGAWVPDGRAKAILADCEASLTALDGLPIDVYLVHSPDPRTPWRTSVRALARLLDERLVGRVGLSNVGRGQLDEALELVPVGAVEVALSFDDDRALRGGTVDRCAELGIPLIAHSPLGGPRRARALERQATVARAANVRGVAPAEVALAWLLESSPAIIAIPGARRPDTARSAAHAATLRLDARERAALSRALDATTRARRAPRPRRDGAEIVMIMGIPGAGKTRAAADYVARGYVRLNRDERGGGLRALAGALDEGLRSGARRMVLDNTYLSRASRSYVIDVASRHRIPVGCVWLNTPLVQAQVNMVQRLLARAEALPSPEELRRLARTEEGMLTPTSQMRATRQLEPPSTDEGFARIEIMPFVRRPASEAAAPGVFVAAPALREPGWENSLTQSCDAAPHLVFDWNPGAEPGSLAPTVARLTALVSGPVEGALCPHGGGPPICWCRPPLPGLPLAFARANGVDPSRSILVGSRPAHRTLAATLGADYVPV